MNFDLLDPGQMRAVAAALLDAADRLDQADRSGPVPSADELQGKLKPFEPNPVRQLSELTVAEANKVRLRRHARELYDLRGTRARYFDQDIFGEAPWDILLDLFIHYCEDRLVGVQSACIASRVPPTTALRYIALLEKCGYIRSQQSNHDKRLRYLSLTNTAFLKMAKFLEAWRPAPQMQPSWAGDYLVTAKPIPDAANT